LPEKNAKRDILHGIKQLEEMGECWTAARRTLRVLCVCAEKWEIELPDEAQATFARTRFRWGLADPNTGSMSPDTLASMTQQISSSLVSEPTARNLQQDVYAPQQSLATWRAALPQGQFGLSAAMAPSPAETVDTRRSSGNFSLPPYSATDLTRGIGRIRPSTHLTKEQQEAWNALQARMAVQSGQRSRSSVPANANASSLFGGVESLIEEAQDWWYNDQNQLAMGFDNWTESTPEWPMNELGTGMAMTEVNSWPMTGGNNFFSLGSNVMDQSQAAATQHVDGSARGSVSEMRHSGLQQYQHRPIHNGVQLKRHSTFEDEAFY